MCGRDYGEYRGYAMKTNEEMLANARQGNYELEIVKTLEEAKNKFFGFLPKAFLSVLIIFLVVILLVLLPTLFTSLIPAATEHADTLTPEAIFGLGVLHWLPFVLFSIVALIFMVLSIPALKIQAVKYVAGQPVRARDIISNIKRPFRVILGYISFFIIPIMLLAGIHAGLTYGLVQMGVARGTFLHYLLSFIIELGSILIYIYYNFVDVLIMQKRCGVFKAFGTSFKSVNHKFLRIFALYILGYLIYMLAWSPALLMKEFGWVAAVIFGIAVMILVFFAVCYLLLVYGIMYRNIFGVVAQESTQETAQETI